MADEPLDFFAAESPSPTASSDQGSVPDLNGYRARLGELALRDVFLGTSSWKYPGWCGLVYDEQRYLTRGKFSEAKLNKTCLEERSGAT